MPSPQRTTCWTTCSRPTSSSCDGIESLISTLNLTKVLGRGSVVAVRLLAYSSVNKLNKLSASFSGILSLPAPCSPFVTRRQATRQPSSTSRAPSPLSAASMDNAEVAAAVDAGAAPLAPDGRRVSSPPRPVLTPQPPPPPSSPSPLDPCWFAASPLPPLLDGPFSPRIVGLSVVKEGLKLSFTSPPPLTATPKWIVVPRDPAKAQDRHTKVAALASKRPLFLSEMSTRRLSTLTFLLSPNLAGGEGLSLI